MAVDLSPYRVVQRLGEGARSVIYEVCVPGSKQHFALKYVSRNDPKDIRFIEQMTTEFVSAVNSSTRFCSARLI